MACAALGRSGEPLQEVFDLPLAARLGEDAGQSQPARLGAGGRDVEIERVRAAHHDDLAVIDVLLQQAEQFEPVAVRHEDIQEEQGRLPVDSWNSKSRLCTTARTS